jgi:DNA damage-binding protein 1
VSPWQAVDPEDVSVDVVSEERPPAALVAVGLWTDSSVRLLDLSSLAEVASTSGKGEGQLRAQAQARAVLLVTLGDCRLPSLLVGLGDGTLIVYTLAEGSMSPELTKKIILGTQPISLTAFLSSGATCAFAACDRPAVVFGRSDKVSFSVVNFGEVAAMASFSSELFPECMALVTPAGLSVASVDDIQKIHIQTFHLGESPKYIAYSKNAAAYAGRSVGSHRCCLMCCTNTLQCAPRIRS